MLSADDARRAFDLSSGEVHAAVSGVLLDDSRFVREAVLGRLDQGFGEAGTGGAGAEAIAPGPAWGVWGQGVGSSAEADGDGNAASFSRSLGGFFAGVDARQPGAWRIGGAVGYLGSSVSLPDRASAASITGYHAAAYGALEAGGFALRFGGAAATETVATIRNDMFSGFNETLSASYGATVSQLFSEAAYRAKFGRIEIEPFADIARVRVSTDGFSESGGIAALSSAPQSHAVTFTTIGARFGTLIPLGASALKLSASVAWQHVIGDATPTAELAFAGGTPFTVAGVPIKRDALRLQADTDWTVGQHTTISVGYSGQLASGFQDHAVTARLSIRF
jgi:outer membrane autotransporter protein